jgi:hypothetical protein
MRERNKQLVKRLSQERSNTTRDKRTESEIIKHWQARQPTDYGQTNNNALAGVLRESKTSKKLMKSYRRKKKEKKWNDRFAVPISTYNEAVFRKFRLSFEEI